MIVESANARNRNSLCVGSGLSPTRYMPRVSTQLLKPGPSKKNGRPMLLYATLRSSPGLSDCAFVNMDRKARSKIIQDFTRWFLQIKVIVFLLLHCAPCGKLLGIEPSTSSRSLRPDNQGSFFAPCKCIRNGILSIFSIFVLNDAI